MHVRFRLNRPTELDDAFEAYSAAGSDAAYVAGGTELLQIMKMGLAQYGTLIDLKRIKGLRGIEREPDGTLRIGGTTTHREIEKSDAVLASLPVLVRLESQLANLRVRNCGTLGGNLAFAEPHSDPATLLLVCDARVELAGVDGRREVPFRDFTLGPLVTERAPDEVVAAIRIPPRERGVGTSYEKIKFFERPAVSVAARLEVEDGSIASCVVALGSMTYSPLSITVAELVNQPSSIDGVDAGLDAASDILDTVDVVEDHNGSADYKRHLARVLVRRAVHGALAEATSRA